MQKQMMAQIQILLCNKFGGDVVDDTSPQLGGNLDTMEMILMINIKRKY